MYWKWGSLLGDILKIAKPVKQGTFKEYNQIKTILGKSYREGNSIFTCTRTVFQRLMVQMNNFSSKSGGEI